MLAPRDFELLNDLLDGRLAPVAEAEVRRRVATEPELASAWDELRRLREAMLALPKPPAPATLLEGARAKAGLAPAAASAAPAGRLLRWPRPAWAVAAGIVAAGVGVFLATRPKPDVDRSIETAYEAPEAAGESSRDGDEADRRVAEHRRAEDAFARDAEKETAPSEPRAKASGGRLGAEVERGAAKPDEPARPASGAAAPPRFRGPGDRVPPDLRPPNDPAPSAPEESLRFGAPPAGSPATPPTPPPPPAPVTTPAGPPVPARAPVPPPAEGGPVPDDAASPAKPALEARRRAEADDSGLEWARADVEEAYVLRADSLDEARAEVAILRARLVGDAAKDAGGVRKAARDDRDKEAGPSDGSGLFGRRAGSAPVEGLVPAAGEGARAKRFGTPPPTVLGTIVLELTDAEGEALARSVAPSADAKARSAPARAPARVRIVVLAR
jgi:hypothetical protein